ncbi:unnamed protein product [Spirodela intermedia]|uniref:Uncharacterized protein n=1 Tax=Spirodela intermedia TaxID=51605 RepID=A0A7I8JD85_SPIIN|nr:unnamed protein product [Spirodela intermedia]CAA6668128.1 unnamed protein product [Spirodela intermedia]
MEVLSAPCCSYSSPSSSSSSTRAADSHGGQAASVLAPRWCPATASARFRTAVVDCHGRTRVLPAYRCGPPTRYPPPPPPRAPWGGAPASARRLRSAGPAALCHLRRVRALHGEGDQGGDLRAEGGARTGRGHGLHPTSPPGAHRRGPLPRGVPQLRHHHRRRPPRRADHLGRRRWRRPGRRGLQATDVPFSISTKRVFDAAHIAIGLLTVDDGSAGQVLKRGRKVGGGSPESFVLAQFCNDLTAQAADGLIDPIIGRETEVQRIVQILCRRTKNNPILLGEPGVGKTAIAEGLAIRIADGEVPIFLSRIMSLDIGLLMAGAKERGELEARVTGLISEVKKAGDVILFIDEVHTLIGSGTVGRGSKGSNLDIGNLLKPALGRGELQCIASTTIDEHRLHFEKDKALARRFQPVLINEPTEEDAVKILVGLREKYEAHHRCRFTMEAIDAALPDKAIDLIDEAGSRARMDAFKRKKEQATSKPERAPRRFLFRAYRRSSVLSLHPRVVAVGAEEIAAVASLWSGIPVQQLTADERKTLVGLEELLRRRVIGQDDAVGAISRAVKRSRVGLNDPDRPIAAMLFCGPTGVGKTELTKALADCYFGSETAMLRLDMSEYMERHTVSKLIGSPPGYVGFGEGGTLTEAVRRRPFTVVLLDEIEKAHPDIFNILLQVFEDGHLTDSQVGLEKKIKISAASDDLIPSRRSQMLAILNIMLEEVKSRLAALGIGLEVSEAAMDLVCRQGYDRSYGARPLRRAVTSLIEDVVSEALLGGDFQPGDTVAVDVDPATGHPAVSHHLATAHPGGDRCFSDAPSVL